MTPNLPESLIRPTLQSETKIIEVQKTSGIPYFQASEDAVKGLGLVKEKSCKIKQNQQMLFSLD